MNTMIVKWQLLAWQLFGAVMFGLFGFVFLFIFVLGGLVTVGIFLGANLGILAGLLGWGAFMALKIYPMLPAWHKCFFRSEHHV